MKNINDYYDEFEGNSLYERLEQAEALGAFGDDDIADFDESDLDSIPHRFQLTESFMAKNITDRINIHENRKLFFKKDQ